MTATGYNKTTYRLTDENYYKIHFYVEAVCAKQNAIVNRALEEFFNKPDVIDTMKKYGYKEKDTA